MDTLLINIGTAWPEIGLVSAKATLYHGEDQTTIRKSSAAFQLAAAAVHFAQKTSA